MRIILASGSPYLPSTGGAYKANRLLAEGLVERGHEVHVIALARTAIRKGATLEEFFDELARHGLRADGDGPVYRFVLGGVHIHAVDGGLFKIRDELVAVLDTLAPDRVLISSEDWRQLLLTEALERAPGRVVYLAHTMTALPVGPHSSDPNRSGAELLARAAVVVTPSHWLARYLEPHAPGARIVTRHFPVYGRPPFPRYRCWEDGFVTMINPCEVKGIAIFLDLARSLPDVAFAAVPTWGTTEADRAALAALPNVRTLPASDRIDDILSQTKILLVPSLWQEVFPLVPVEAMLRGIPVIASDAGGLREAMLGVDFTLPVRQIERYTDGVVPAAADVPAQDTGPWRAALATLAHDRAAHEQLAERACEAANRFIAELDVSQHERLLATIDTRQSS